MIMTSQETYGRHSVSIEGPLAIIHFVGPLNQEEGRQFLSLFEQIIAIHGHCYFIAHIDKASTIDSAFRREFVEWMKTHPLLGIANIKGSIVARSVGILMSNALRLVGAIHCSTGFFATEAEARRWITELARKQQARQSSGFTRIR
jgi:hypothetical protein